MEWHQPWLLGLDQEECEALHLDATYYASSCRRKQQWGLAIAWRGLAHEALERAMELHRSSSEGPIIRDQLALDVPAGDGGGAYGERS